MTYRPSIAERITWTCGQLSASDVKVLAALWSCGDYETGRNCRPSVNTIVARAGLSRATVTRTLARLRNDGWIVPTSRRHRHTTSYDIQIDRLATTPPKEQQVSLSAVLDPPRSEAQNEPQPKSEAQNEPQPPEFEAQNEPPPVRTDHLDLLVRTHTPRARETADESEAQNEPQAVADLPLIGRPASPRCAHPYRHAWCEGRVHVPRDLHFEMLDRLDTQPGESPATKAGRLVQFYAATMRHLPPEAAIADAYTFWKAAFKAWVERIAHPQPMPARRPDIVTDAVCPHVPRCATYRACLDRILTDRRAEREMTG